MNRRVVVTGLGLITPVGNTVADSWNAIKDGRSGIAPIEGFDTSNFASRIGGMIKDSIMNRPTIAAATMSDEEYEEYLRNQMMGGGRQPYMAPMAALDTPPVGLAPTGGFVGQTPNYLNFAQQSLGGPY